MAVASASTDFNGPSPSTNHPPSRRDFDAVPDSSAAALSPSDSAEFSDRLITDLSISSPSPSRQLDSQLTRSEEYRQLFRLPPEEVLIQDFNCALQENFLLQGHMYLFAHFICFYSNLFGYETKKIIPFQEITSVRRAKTAAIFPTAIEILAGEKKHFFTSFLSRDEAFRIIYDGWLQHADAAKEIADPQEISSEIRCPENGSAMLEATRNSKQAVDGSDVAERNMDVSVLEDSNILPYGNIEIMPPSLPLHDNVEMDAEVLNNCSPSRESFIWQVADTDAPEVPEGYMMVAESMFQIEVEEFFSLFFSDNALNFVEAYHRKCGNIDFKCTSWYSDGDFGVARNVSFKHPVKLYFGARFSGCQDVQKYRVYRNSHLVIESSQQVSDVPYCDYFHVQGILDVKRDGDESKERCILKVYINVAFSKKTMFKGKIVQSTMEECRETYAIWIDLAHELLKQNKLRNEVAGGQSLNLIPNDQVHHEGQVEATERSERSNEDRESSSFTSTDIKDVNKEFRGDHMEGSLNSQTSVVSLFKESAKKLVSSLKSQSHVPLFVVAILAMILLLMQISILMLLARPQTIQVIAPPPAELSGMETTTGLFGERRRSEMVSAVLETQITHLKDEIHMVETLLDKMRHDVALLKMQLRDFEPHK